MATVRVIDAVGQELSPCSPEKAQDLVAAGKAEWAGNDPPTIRLQRVIDLPPPPPELPEEPLAGERLLLHVCCAPCATYTVKHLRELGAQVTGYWYNPNIHPFSEHEKRRETLEQFAKVIDLPMIFEPGYEMPEFLRAVTGQERFRQRCRICYRMRLERTAQTAAREGLTMFSTTLLISPYQDLDFIRQVGQELGEAYGVEFYFENMRKGFAEHHEMARTFDLYRQSYCGCIYSEWEALDKSASTHERSNKQ